MCACAAHQRVADWEEKRGGEGKGTGQTKERLGEGVTPPPRLLLPSEVSHLGLSSSHNKAGNLPPLSGHYYCLAAAAAGAADSSGHRRSTKWLAAILQCL